MPQIRVSLLPVLTINAVFLGHSESYLYNKDGSKTLDPNNVYLRFATAMQQKIGEITQTIPIEKVLDLLGNDSNQSSISCKIPSNTFEPSSFKAGSKGILQLSAGGVGGNVYYRFIDFTAKNNTQSPPPSPAMSSK